MKFKFRALINLHHRHIYAIALRILADAAEAEDAVQDVYERLWQNIDNVHHDEAKPWLVRVTRNLCIDKLRARKPTDNIDNIEPIPCQNNEPNNELASTQLSQWVRDAIEKLKEPYRTLILQLDIEQKTTAEVAQQLNLNENQIKVYRHRARKYMRAHLQGIEL